MELIEAKQQFIHSWGTLGATWGINKVMGQIHALLLVSPEALTTDDIMEELQISRGNANMNIRALMDWGVVTKEYMPGTRKDYYKCDKDILELARRVTIERRRREVAPLINTLQQLQNVTSKQSSGQKSNELKEFQKVTGDILSFSKSVDKALEKFAVSDKNWFLKKLMKLFV